jgi:hypothetical protein
MTPPVSAMVEPRTAQLRGIQQELPVFRVSG